MFLSKTVLACAALFLPRIIFNSHECSTAFVKREMSAALGANGLEAEAWVGLLGRFPAQGSSYKHCSMFLCNTFYVAG